MTLSLRVVVHVEDLGAIVVLQRILQIDSMSCFDDFWLMYSILLPLGMPQFGFL